MDTLTRLRPKFVENLHNVEEILDHLFSEGIFVQSDVTRVSCFPNRRDMIRQLLDILSRKIPSYMNKFYEILLLTGNKILADEVARLSFNSYSGETSFKCPTEEMGDCCYMVRIEGCTQEDYLCAFIKNYSQNKHVDSKSVLTGDLFTFLKKEIADDSSNWGKYAIILYFVMCDPELLPIRDVDYVKQVLTVTEIILKERRTKSSSIACLICCENSSIEETFKYADDFVIAALHKDRFKNLLSNIPTEPDLVFNYIKTFGNQS